MIKGLFQTCLDFDDMARGDQDSLQSVTKQTLQKAAAGLVSVEAGVPPMASCRTSASGRSQEHQPGNKLSRL